MPSITEYDQNKEFQNSSKEILGWIVLRDKIAHSSEMKVPLWSSFNETLESKQSFSQADVSDLPPITSPPTQMNVKHD